MTSKQKLKKMGLFSLQKRGRETFLLSLTTWWEGREQKEQNSPQRCTAKGQEALDISWNKENSNSLKEFIFYHKEAQERTRLTWEVMETEQSPKQLALTGLALDRRFQSTWFQPAVKQNQWLLICTKHHL